MRIRKSRIYQIVNEVNGHSYVGSSQDINLQLLRHYQKQ